MPPKKKGTAKKSMVSRKEESRGSKDTVDSETKSEKKKEKHKPMSKKELENLRKMERAMKEKIAQLRKEADSLLAELKASEEATQRKNENEMVEHNKRLNVVTGVCENFKMAKSRLVHENNKIREQEIWERYIDTNQLPYPEETPNMHTHLFVWDRSKSVNMEFTLNKCDEHVNILNILNHLIEYPLYSTKETVNNWIEMQQLWRNEFLAKIDKACFNLIKNLAVNFTHNAKDPDYVLSFEETTDHLKLAMTAWIDKDNFQHLKPSPKIDFPSFGTEIVMPAAYRKNPFILRMIYFDIDFLSDTSASFKVPETLAMEPDLLLEVNRCFDTKSDAKASVADREREKVRSAKQKVLDAQAAASLAEKSFETFQQKTKRPSNTSDSGQGPAPTDRIHEEPKRKKQGKELTLMLESPSEMMLQPGAKRPKGVLDDRDGASTARSLMQSEETQKALDAISMRSGMKKKVMERMKKMTKVGSDEEEYPTNVFWTHSMISVTQRHPKVEVRRASELCFEEEEDEGSRSLDITNLSEPSYESLDMLFGIDNDEEEEAAIPSIKTLVRNTIVVPRDAKQRTASKSVASQEARARGRKRGKSIGSMKKLTEESDELQQTASEIYDAKEDLRQDNYLSSLVVSGLVNRRFHLNLRTFTSIGGVYFLDIISPLSQPRELSNGCTVQIFYGDQDIKRDFYEYNYVPPPTPEPNSDPDELPPVDQGLQHLISVKVPLPKNVLYADNMPIVAQWDNENKYWSKQHVHHLKIDMQTNYATFEVGRPWPFAFFIEKYSLLPYTNWRLKPRFDIGGVCLSINCQNIQLELSVMNFEVGLTSADGLENPAIVEDIVGKYMHLYKLIKEMQVRGLNIFPEEDALLYARENTSKDVVLEDHTCMSIAMMSDTLEFHSCQYNSEYKRRKLAFQVRECLAYNLELRFRTVTSTALSASIYRCNDDDTSLDETKLENFGFCPDVSTLLEKAFSHATPSTALNPLQVVTVYNLLTRTKVLSYCGFSRKETTSSSSITSKKSPRKKAGKKPGGRLRGKLNKTPGSRSSNLSGSMLLSSLADF